MKIGILIAALAATLAPAVAAAQADNGTLPRSAPAVAASLVVKDSSGTLTGFNVTSGATAGYVMVFDSATVPADGAVTPTRCIPIAANVGIEVSYRGAPLRMYRGATIVFSSTGCYAKTASATAFIAGDAR